MAISLSVSSVLLPEHASVPCTYRSHGAIVESLQGIAEATGSALCESIAYVSDFYGDIDLIELPDSALNTIHLDLQDALDPDDPAVRAIAETILERQKFRSALPEKTLLCAMFRDRIRTMLEIECGGKLYDSLAYKWAAQHGAVPELRWLFTDMFRKIDRWRDKPDRNLVVRGCLGADRIA